MCPPDYFTVDYVINPWTMNMRRLSKWNRSLVCRTWFLPQTPVPSTANGFELLDLDEKIGFEGAGDCLFDRGGPWLWTGYGYRTEIEAHAEIQKYFDVQLVSIKLTDSRFYHIDTCFCPLTDGFLMYHPPAFDFDSRIAIESRIPPHKRIIVDTMDAGNFACNAVNVGDTVILNQASDPLKARLMLAGFKVQEVGMSEFLKAGGSAKCLTLKLVEPLRS
jgi:N-dimethylarginine dimethylaminohydrolase